MDSHRPPSNPLHANPAGANPPTQRGSGQPGASPPLRRTRRSGLAYADSGEGPLFVIFHGLPGTVRDFWRLSDALDRRGARTIRFDLPGFGESKACKAPTRWPELADFLATELDELDEEHVLLGHSFGAPLASMVAARHRRTRGLALVAPVGLKAHRFFRMVGAPKLIGAAARQPKLVSGVATEIFRRGLIQAGFSPSIGAAESQRTMKLLGTYEFSHHEEAIAQLKVPVLGAYCLDDPAIEPEICADLLARCPAGPRHVYDTGGHNPQKTHVDELADALRDFHHRR